MRLTPTWCSVRARRIMAMVVLVMVAAAFAAVDTPRAGAVSGPTADWMQLRYDASRTAFNPNESALGAADLANLHRVWFKGPAQTNPVVEHGHVLTCSAGSCYNRLLDNGQLIWKVTERAGAGAVLVAADQLFARANRGSVEGMLLSDGSPTVSLHQPGGLATPVAYHAGRIFGSGNHGHVHGFSIQPGLGSWTSAKLFGMGQTGTPGPPGVGANRVFVGECGAIAAFREDNGRFRWSVPVPGSAPTACTQIPMVVGSTVVAATTALTALDAVTGTQLWSTPSDGGAFLAPAAGYGHVFAVAPTAGTLSAYNLADGNRLWSVATDATSPPSVANGVVYATGPSGLHAYDASTGAGLATVPGVFGGEVVVAEGHLLIGCQDPALGYGTCVYAP
jgi:outer membrane protein assembly factor BamB